MIGEAALSPSRTPRDAARVRTSSLRNAILVSLGALSSLSACGAKIGDEQGSAAGDTVAKGGSAPSGGTAGTSSSGGSDGSGASGATTVGGGASGATTVGGGAAGVAGSSPTDVFVCGTATPSKYPGVETCEQGGLRRVASVKCKNGLPRAGGGQCKSTSDTRNDCGSDADCTARPFGACWIYFPDQCVCDYGCETDDDCGAGFACLCESPVGRCVEATCRTGADCASGTCRVDLTEGCAHPNLLCATEADVCDGPKDCHASGQGSTCVRKGAAFACGAFCNVGRPLIGTRGAVVASLVIGEEHGGWS